jgi:hypothetical protein
MSNEVRQDSNDVSGYQAGRDININSSPSRRLSLMGTLVEAFRKEVASDEKFRDFIDSLDIYLRPAPEQSLVGLEGKLEAGNRSSDLKMAMALKELFSKKLARHRLSRAAQEIFAYILGRLDLLFDTEIAPLIKVDKSKEEVNLAVRTMVLEPVFRELEDNVLILNYQEIRGMIYYLTGNCYIKWAP